MIQIFLYYVLYFNTCKVLKCGVEKDGDQLD